MTGPGANAAVLRPLDVATGIVLGAPRRPEPLHATSGQSPLEALERAVLPGLLRPPCLISFSGGRDSSAVLAAAVRVARREGLPDPIPATNRFRAAPAADERRWQELVLAHLELDDRLVLTFDRELDVLGPFARRVLRRHGLLWPFNAHFHVPMLEAARDGTLLTGIGGDELFRAAATPLPELRPRSVALYAAPRFARRRWHGRASVALHPWLTEAGLRQARHALAAWEAAEPRRVRARLRHVRAARYLRVGTGSLDLLARDAGAAIAHPLLAPSVWAAVARSAPLGGYSDRTAAMRAVFEPLLPAELLARHDKACFDEVFFHQHSRAFAAAWTGAGVPAGLVDADALREHWLGEAPRAQSFSLLQGAWLASQQGVQQPVGGRVERVPAAGPPQPQHR